MLKRLLKRPMFWSLLALIACVVWPLRPLDRTALFPVQFANGKYGYVNPDGRVAVAGVWDMAYSYAADGRALVKREDKHGFIDREGMLCAALDEEVKMINPFRMKPFVKWRGKEGQFSNTAQIVAFNNGHVPLWKYKPRKRGLRQDGRVIVDPVWDDIYPFDAANLAAVQKDGLWGFIDRMQKVVIPLQWQSASPFAKNGLACVMKDERYGFIDRTGRVVIPPQWEGATRFHANGLARVRKDGKYGFIDHTGNITISARYDDAGEFDHGNIARVQIGDRHGFIGQTGETVIPIQWDRIGDFDDWKSPLVGIEIIDSDGNPISRSSDDKTPTPDIEGLASVEKNGKFGCLNRNGEVVVDVEWDYLSHFDDKGLAQIRQNNKHGLINRKGEIVIPPVWDAPLDFDDKQMAVAQKGRKYGFIDPTGKTVLGIHWDALPDPVTEEIDGKPVPLEYREILRFAGRSARFDSQNMAIVKRNRKYGFIDRSEKIILPLIWDDAYAFDSKGMAIVKRDGKFGFINRAGEILVEPIWDDVDNYDNDEKCCVTKNGKSGYINRQGETLIPTDWDSLSPLKRSDTDDLLSMVYSHQEPLDPATPDVLGARKDKTWGYIDWTSKVLVAPEWDTTHIRSDAGAEQCCFVVSRKVADDAQPAWLKSARDWLLGLIGRAEQRNVVCHLYATDGVLLWSSDWLSSTFWSLAVAAIAALVLACDGIAIWRQRRREQ